MDVWGRERGRVQVHSVRFAEAMDAASHPARRNGLSSTDHASKMFSAAVRRPG